MLVAVVVGKGNVVVVRKSCCFVGVAKCCIFVVANVTGSIEIVEVAETIGVVVKIVAVAEKPKLLLVEKSKL